MHALKLYGPCTGRQNVYGAARGPVPAPWVDVRFLFKTAREQPVRGPGVWCDWALGQMKRPYWLSHIQPRAPYDFYHPYDLSPVTSGYGPRTAWHGCILVVWLNNSHDPRVPCAMPVRASYGPARESSVFFMSSGTHTGPVRDTQGCRTVPLRTHKGIDTTRIGKNPARASYLVVWAPCDPRMGCSRAVNDL